MSKKLYVGGLSWNTDEDLLQQTFGQFGTVVECKVIRDRDTGRSRGFGFVHFEDGNAAYAAIESLNGKELDGRSIVVNEARERTGGPGGGGRRGGGGGGGGYGGGGGNRDRW